jgi:hypothetical protein
MSRPIQLHADLVIDPKREAEAVHYFETVYRPTAMRFEGYMDLRLLKLTAALVGAAPARVNYRFSIAFTSEALRQRWVASDAPHGSVGASRDVSDQSRIRLPVVRSDLTREVRREAC